MTEHKNHISPRWIKRLLFRLLHDRVAEASLGDLEEKFQQRLKNHMSPAKATWLYILEGLGFLRMATLKENTALQTDVNIMNHTLVFFARLIRRDTAYYLVSILGLALSVVSFLLIMMFVQDERAYDQFHEAGDRIYRVTTHLRLSDVEYAMATTAFPAARAIEADIAGVHHAVRVYRQHLVFEEGDKKFEESVVLTDDAFFEVFTFTFLEGDATKALRNPSSIVLTKSAALRYFGSEGAMGKTLKLYNYTLEVTGVINDVPEQSHIKFDMVIPLSLQLAIWKSETGLEGRENKWFWIGAYTYVLLHPGTDAAIIQEKLSSIVDKYFPERYKANGKLKLQPLTKIHLTSHLSNEMERGGSSLYLKLFTAVALVILVVSAINLINLSWFKISARMRELGVRKFLGQQASRIIAQLCIESMLLGVTAFIVAVLIATLFIHPFNNLVQKNLDLYAPSNLALIGVTLTVILIIAVLGVIKPAMRYAHASGLRMMQRHTGSGTARLRNLLMGVQIGVSFVLLVFSFVVGGQIDFFKHTDLGFNRDNIVIVELNEDFYEHLDAFKAELLKSNDIVSAAGGKVPGNGYDGWRFVPEGGSYEEPVLLPLAWVDHDYLPTLGIQFLNGSNFNPSEQYDSLWSFIINQSAARELGWGVDAVHKKMAIFAPGTTNIMAHGVVIGLIDDYHFESLHKPVKPAVLALSGEFSTVLIRISGATHTRALQHIEQTWKAFSGKTFVYELLDKRLEKLYTNETKLAEVILFFTAIALYLTCYGMYAMSSLLFSSRLREVAIRKVFGANHWLLIRQFYIRYALFSAAAIALSIPVALYIGNLWLQSFPYRIALTSAFFVKAGTVILVAGLISVSYYLIKVSYSNPVKFLRNE